MLTSITVSDFHKICRFCLIEKEVYPIWGNSDSDLPIADLLDRNIVDVNNKNLPQNICEKCIDDLYKVYKFNKQCRESQDILKTILQATQVDQDITNIDKDSESCNIDDTFVVDINVNEDNSILRKNHKLEKNDEDVYTISNITVGKEHVVLETDKKNVELKSDKCDTTSNKKDFKRRRTQENHQIRIRKFQYCVICKRRNQNGRGQFNRERGGLNGNPSETSGESHDYICETCKSGSKSHLLRHLLNTHELKNKVCKPDEDGINLDKDVKSNIRKILRITRIDHNYSLVDKNQNQNGVKSKKVVEYKCHNCDYVATNREDLQQHRKDMNHMKKRSGYSRRWHCEICNKKVTGRAEHMKIHAQERPYQCEFCPKEFKLKFHFKCHVMKHTGERPFLCAKCGCGFICRKQLLQHEKHFHSQENANIFNHLQGNKFRCSHCPRTFKYPHHFNVHVRAQHTSKRVKNHNQSEQSDDPRDYICEICGRGFKTKKCLKTHKLTHGEKTFLCSECGKTFLTTNRLRLHFRIHTGEKPYTCHICKRSFRLSCILRNHMLTHTGERLYSCTFCSKSFKLPHNLRQHLMFHTGERPYSCQFCNKSFAAKQTLIVHERRHTGEKPFSCPVCGKQFLLLDRMKIHKETCFTEEAELGEEQKSNEALS